MPRRLAGATLASFVVVALGCSRDPDRVVAIADAAPDVAPAPSMEVTVVEPETLGPPRPPGWNPTKIEWLSYDAGLLRAQRTKKPICLVLYTTWCPHCREFSHIFDDERIAESARAFVMVRVDADMDLEVSRKYRPDGSYVPRTFFLSSDGTLDKTIHAPKPKHQFNFEEDDPGSLLLAMETASRKLAKR